MNIIENEYVKFWIDDGILYGTFKNPIFLGVEEASEIIQLRHNISKEKSQYWCMDFRNLKSTTKEVHDYVYANGQEYVEAFAVIVNSVLSKFMVDVFMSIKKPNVPMKIFSSEEGAVEWLLSMKETKKHLSKCLN